MKIIEVEKLNFEYPGKRVLHDVSFSIENGSVTALVGPNGTGKTTLMRCIAALDTPHSGRVVIDGIDVADEPRKVHRLCGYLSDFFGLYEQLTVRQCLTYAAWCHNIEASLIGPKIDLIADQVDVKNMLDKEAGTLSRGYRQRLGIGLALIHDPKILILDEPASGMDPEARIRLSGLMKALRQDGRTIIVSSHILSELEDYCTDMLVMRDGRISDHVRLSEHEQKSGKTLHIKLAGPVDAALELLGKYPGVSDVRQEGQTLACGFSGDAEGQNALLRALIGAGVAVAAFSVAEQSLQDAYMTTAAAAAERK